MNSRTLSLSMFSELIGIEDVLSVDVNRSTSTVTVVTEDEMQNSGTFPQLSDNTKRKPTKKGGKR